MVALRGTSTGSLLVSEGEGAAKGETKNERRNGSGGEGENAEGYKLLKGIFYILSTSLKVVVHNDDHCHPIPPRTSLDIFLKTTLNFGFFILNALFTSKTRQS